MHFMFSHLFQINIKYNSTFDISEDCQTLFTSSELCNCRIFTTPTCQSFPFSYMCRAIARPPFSWNLPNPFGISGLLHVGQDSRGLSPFIGEGRQTHIVRSVAIVPGRNHASLSSGRLDWLFSQSESFPPPSPERSTAPAI